MGVKDLAKFATELEAEIIVVIFLFEEICSISNTLSFKSATITKDCPVFPPTHALHS